MGRRSSTVSILALVVASATCRSDDRARVGFTFFEEPGFSADLLILEFSDGSGARRLRGVDFSRGTGSRLDTRVFETRTSGTLLTAFWLVEGSDTLSAGDLRIDLRPDWEWNIGFMRGSENPAAMCFGCVGAAAYGIAEALQGTPSDSLWLVWGGNSISDPVVF